MEELKSNKKINGSELLFKEFCIDGLDFDDDIFEQRTREALEQIERDDVQGIPASKFLKKLETSK